MKRPARIIVEYGGLALLTGAILALDITSPQGIDAWLLYLLPLALTFLLPEKRGRIVFLLCRYSIAVGRPSAVSSRILTTI